MQITLVLKERDFGLINLTYKTFNLKKFIIVNYIKKSTFLQIK